MTTGPATPPAIRSDALVVVVGESSSTLVGCSAGGAAPSVASVAGFPDIADLLASGVRAIVEVPERSLRRDDDGVTVPRDAVRLWTQPAGSQPVCIPVPPFDVAVSPYLPQMPEIPGASVACQYSLLGAPLGELDYLQRIVDGRVVELVERWVPDADVYVELPYVNYLRLRLGECELVDALEGGHLKGDIAPLSVLAGVLESPEFQAAWADNAGAVAVLAELLASGVDLLSGDDALSEVLR